MSFTLRAMKPEERFEVAEMIYASINTWYQKNGKPPIFRGGPRVTEVFYDVYQALTPDCNVVAVNPASGRLMGSCFYHPREHHVSLGIMTVHPNYFGQGVGGTLLKHIIDFTERHGFRSLRLTASAINLDSFSLYNRAGFVPRCAFQDMFLDVPAAGLQSTLPNLDKVRPATNADIPALAALEMDISGISRELDYRYCIKNESGLWHVAVYEDKGNIDGFMISTGHPAMNMLGPCLARSEREAAALIWHGLNLYRGRAPVFLVPVERTGLVKQMYEWGAKNCELHFCQVRGDFKPFAGISMPTFLPETG